MTPKTFDILFAREKDSLSLTFCHTTAGAKAYIPKDLTGWTLKSSILLGEDNTSMSASDNFNLSFDNQKMGVVRIELPKDHTLAAGTYWYSVRGVDQNNEETVLLRGKLEVERSLFQ